jgi:hypothetical protein
MGGVMVSVLASCAIDREFKKYPLLYSLPSCYKIIKYNFNFVDPNCNVLGGEAANINFIIIGLNQNYMHYSLVGKIG